MRKHVEKTKGPGERSAACTNAAYLELRRSPMYGAAEACAEAFFPQWKVRDPGARRVYPGVLRAVRPHRSDITATPN